ncbi:MAG: hypothetical protein EOM53_05810, partial [Alphaproteobacteria bacterium]|nr:hypothetical protein [Alphaproteobacteria bacterium]
MRIRQKIIVFFIVLFFFFIAGLFFQKNSGEKMFKDLFVEREEESQRIFKKLLELYGEPLRNFTVDYSYWDEMVDFIKRPVEQEQWAIEYIPPAMETYKSYATAIFNLDYDVVFFSVDNDEDEDLGLDAFLKKIPKEKLFEEDPNYCHFFFMLGEDLIEARGATVHQAADPQKKSPKGYFFAFRLWDEKLLNELESLTASHVTLQNVIEIESFKENRRKNQNQNQNQNQVVVYEPLLDLDNRVVSYVKSKKTDHFIALLQKQKERYFLMSFIFSFGFVLSSIFFFSLWVGVPLGNIILALRKQNVDLLLN